LFPEAVFDKLHVAPLPEVQRANLAQVILQLKVLGVESVGSFSFLSPPADMALENAYKLLLQLGAINKVRLQKLFR
jgi:HrpA-like RNA helicase